MDLRPSGGGPPEGGWHVQFWDDGRVDAPPDVLGTRLGWTSSGSGGAWTRRWTWNKHGNDERKTCARTRAGRWDEKRNHDVWMNEEERHGSNGDNARRDVRRNGMEWTRSVRNAWDGMADR